MKGIPAIPVFTLLQHYALARKLPFWTIADQMKAWALYVEHAKINN